MQSPRHCHARQEPRVTFALQSPHPPFCWPAQYLYFSPDPEHRGGRWFKKAQEVCIQTKAWTTLFTVAQRWGQHEWLVHACISQPWPSHTIEEYSATRRDHALTRVTRMNLRNTALTERSQTRSSPMKRLHLGEMSEETNPGSQEPGGCQEPGDERWGRGE